MIISEGNNQKREKLEKLEALPLKNLIDFEISLLFFLKSLNERKMRKKVREKNAYYYFLI
jgi:hypothetical protein